jgi:hypothetical protein
MTREQIEAKLKAAKDNREQLIAQINATNGYIQAYEEMLEAQEASVFKENQIGVNAQG